MSAASDIANRHVAAFNEAVATGDFADFLGRFDDAAVIRFENVPSAGLLEFAGRPAYTQAYARLPPDDQIEITGTAGDDGGDVVILFAWRRDGSRGTMRLGFAGGLVMRMTVTFA
jgi:steroid Delta-isomerase